MATILGSPPLKMALGCGGSSPRGGEGVWEPAKLASGLEAVREEGAATAIIPSFPPMLTRLSPLHGEHVKPGFAPRDLGLKS